jgi:hypothetical protein
MPLERPDTRQEFGGEPGDNSSQPVAALCISANDYSADCMNGTMEAALRTYAGYYVNKIVAGAATALTTKYLRVRLQMR